MLRSLIKFLLHVVTGKCELERIISKRFPAGKHRTLVLEVRESLKLSKQLLRQAQQLLQGAQENDVKQIAQSITRIKNLPNSTTTPGLLVALNSLENANNSILYLLQQAKKQFSYEENVNMLEQLWSSLKPGQALEGGNVRKSQSWSEIGFQGLDPSTDFRGAGLLSLENLRYFSSGDTMQEARRILREHGRDVTVGGFPFACVGINLTAFLLDLAVRRKIDALFVYEQDVNTRRGGEHEPLLQQEQTPEQLSTQELALERFNKCYCVLFVLFARRWAEARPKDAMGFPSVFNPFKREVELVLASPRGMAALVEL